MTATRVAPATSARGRRVQIAIVAAAVVVIAAIALLRGGALGLPPAPRDVTAARAGIANLPGLGARAAALEAAAAGGAAPADPVLAAAAEGLRLARDADPEQGIAKLRAAYAAAPADLVIGNAYRMEIIALKRRYIADAALGGTETERLPEWLAHEPIASLEQVAREHPGREPTLQLALGWADEIVLFHALEIQAPANVESVKLLTELLAREPSYVPALYGRGLGYLHRPSRLVWPEARRAAPDAASRDLGLAVAIGTKLGGASPRLKATLTLALGDAYAKEGRPDRARSWWQVTQNASADPDLREAVRRRFAWQDGEMVERLEAELTDRLLTGPPLTDLAVMWR